MGQIPSSRSNIHSESQEIHRLLWNPKVHYRVHKGQPLAPILSHMNPIHTFPPYNLKISLKQEQPFHCLNQRYSTSFLSCETIVRPPSQAMGWMVAGSIPSRSCEFFCSPPCSDWLWSPPSLLSNG